MAATVRGAASELGKNPVRKHQIQPEYGDEQADTGRSRNCVPMALTAKYPPAHGQYRSQGSYSNGCYR